MPFGDTPAFDRGIDRGFMMPVGELITSALSNKGNPTGILQDNTFRVKPDQDVRIVDKSGQVLFSGVGPDAARQAVAIGQNLSDTLGNKAGWTIQTGERAITDTGEPQTYFYDVANEKVNKSVLGQIAGTLATGALGALVGGPVGLLAGPLAKAAGVDDEIMKYGLPIALSLTPLGPVAGSALGSALGTAYTGGDIGDILKSAAISGATAGTLKVTGADKFLGSALTKIPGASEATQAVASNIANATGQSVANEAVKQAADELVVTAIKSAAPNLLSGAISGFTTPTLSNAIASSSRPSLLDQIQTQAPGMDQLPEIIATANPLTMAVPAAVAAPVSEAVTQLTQATPQEQAPEAGPEIVATAQNILPPAFTAPEALAASAAANALGSTVAQSPEVTQGMTQQEIEDVTMKGAGGAGLLAKLTSNMGLTDYLTAASLLGSGVSSLFGGGGAGTTAGPYVSPFGAGVGFGTGQDMRVNPNIADYERYAFGPEATFFAPGYSQLVSGAAGAPMQTTMGPQSAMLNPNAPTYTPLI